MLQNKSIMLNVNMIVSIEQHIWDNYAGEQLSEAATDI